MRRERFRRSVVGALTLAAVCSFGCGGGDAAPEGPAVRLGVPDRGNADGTLAALAPAAGTLSDALGVDVRVRPHPNPDALLAAFMDGDVTLAWFDVAHGLRALEGVPGARWVAGEDGKGGGFYFVAHRSTRLEWSDRFPDLAEHTVVLGPRHSTSGHILPEAVTRAETGRSLADILGAPVRFAGSARETVELVAGGDVDVGAMARRAYDDLLVAGAVDTRNCRVIWKSSSFPDGVLVAHPGLEAEFGSAFVDSVQAAFLELDTVPVLRAFGVRGWRTVDEADFTEVAAAVADIDPVR